MSILSEFLTMLGVQEDFCIHQVGKLFPVGCLTCSHSAGRKVPEEKWCACGTRSSKAIGRKEYTKLRRIFVQIQGARQAHEPCNCRATHKLDDKDKQVGIFFDRNRLRSSILVKASRV
uniref:Uncharacterized protein n=2 Tax=Candidatus Kentrum sp. FM TaxID=2126340 RepID=A0A450TBH5_9GAMM|nr:MAG: hypothetical protein BECKFM1743C_GA0114222_103611 [Candidatus Kentron sp. FM]